MRRVHEAPIGKVVRIVVDHDEKGEKHGQIVAKTIAAHVREVRSSICPALPPKGDLWDWIDAGGRREQLQPIVERTAAFQMPAAVSPEPEPGSAKAAAPENPNSLLKQLQNDTGNAERLILKFGDGLRFCPAFRKWLVWDGRRWAVDDRGAARRLAKQTMLAYLAEATDADDKDNMSFAYSSPDARRVANMLTMAECELVVIVASAPWKRIHVPSGNLQTRSDRFRRIFCRQIEAGPDLPLRNGYALRDGNPAGLQGPSRARPGIAVSSRSPRLARIRDRSAVESLSSAAVPRETTRSNRAGPAGRTSRPA